MIGAFIGKAIGAVPATQVTAADLPAEYTGPRAPLLIPKNGAEPASIWKGSPPR